MPPSWPGIVPAIHALLADRSFKTLMPATSAGMTTFVLQDSSNSDDYRLSPKSSRNLATSLFCQSVTGLSRP
jgi:hypothetical protein